MKYTRCINCCSQFGMETALYDQRLRDGKYFTCPGCGQLQAFSRKKNEESRLKEIIEDRERLIEARRIDIGQLKKSNTFLRDQNQRLLYKLHSQRGATTKLRKRLKLLETDL